ncbi:heme-binding protein [Arthrobacter ginkgonis]|uniref:Heme-binding protein n=1 Tax=Arthrobacter ginkgonis TaxID=1630594 RepID=A0ABP7CIC6_9MICC
MAAKQEYALVSLHPDYELRRYAEHAIAEVTVQASFTGAGNAAFRTLAGYIGGRNRSRRKIPMTAPVAQTGAVRAASERVAMTAPVAQRGAADGGYTVAFVLPVGLRQDTAPVPTDGRVRIRDVPETLAAVRRYRGGWSQESYERHLGHLRAALARDGVQTVGAPRFDRFNPPFTPRFLRRNEVVLDIAAGTTAEDGCSTSTLDP